MPTYYIDTLIAFFLSQQKCEYETIELIISMFEMNDEEFEPEDRWDSILFLLRRSGLHETTAKNGGRFSPRVDKYNIEIEPGLHCYDSRRYTNDFIVEHQSLTFLNGRQSFEFPLN